MANRFIVKKEKYTGSKSMLDIQYRSLGYRTCGNDIDEIDDGYDVVRDSDGKITELKHKSHIEKYAYYRRHEEYPTNLLLGITALNLKLLRIIRKLIVYFMPLLFLLFIISQSDLNAKLPLFYSLVAYGISWAATIFCMIFARSIRAVFKMDERTDKICIDNGWRPYSDYPNE